MKLKNISLKWNLFFIILGFAAIIVLTFVIFQIALLDRFYSSNKIDRTTEIINEISDLAKGVSIDEFTNDGTILSEYINEINLSDETAVYLFSEPTDNITNTNCYRSYVGSSYNKLNPKFIYELWSKAKNTSFNKFYALLAVNPNPMFDGAQILDIKTSKKILIRDLADQNDSIMCCSFIKLNDGNNYLLILDCKIAPVDAAVSTMKMQLAYIAAIVVVLSVIIAIIISKYVSKPITRMSETAKQMAKGDYDVVFEGEGYLEINQLNETLNNTASELKKTETLRRELMANVSHDLRTPLTMITGYAEMMRDLPGENNSNNLQIIIDEVSRLNLLVNDMLDLSKLTSKTIELNPIEYSLTQSLIEIVDRYKKFREENGFEFELIYHEDVKIIADKVKIDQVIYNYINNAINYSKDSKLIKIIQLIEDDNVIIKVQDFGVGINEDDLMYIWERYYRIDKGHKRSSQGSGLGLSIVKSILEYHNFEYGVDSKEGFGSTFWFKIPITK